MFISFCAFPIRVGTADVDPIPSSGKALAVSGPPVAGDYIMVGPRAVATDIYQRVTAVAGLPDTLPDGASGAIVPLAVTSAMRELGLRRPYPLYTPAPLVEEEGVKYAPFLIRHPDLLATGAGEPRRHDDGQRDYEAALAAQGQ